MSRRAVTYAVLVAVPMVAAAGCSSGASGPAKVVPVSGKVTYRGQPVEGAHVTFRNAEVNTTAYATTGPDGAFALTTTKDGDGAVPGKHQVAVRKVEVISRAKPGFDYASSSEVPPPPEERWHTPQRYGSPVSSGLTATVTEAGPNHFEFELKD